jgi:hypothetical protein
VNVGYSFFFVHIERKLLEISIDYKAFMYVETLKWRAWDSDQERDQGRETRGERTGAARREQERTGQPQKALHQEGSF